MIVTRARGHLTRLCVPFVLASVLVGATPGGAMAAPPANDAFADAIAVNEPLPFTDLRDTSDATAEDGEPSANDFGCEFLAASVWYSFVPSTDAIVAADTVGSDFDTVLAVWEGSALDSLTHVACSDDARGGRQSSVPFVAEAGVEYRIQVGGYLAETGSLAFRVRTTSAGVVEGTVSDADTGSPLQGICVLVVDAVFASGDRVGVSRDDGSFAIVARPGEYIVAFVDCERDTYVLEFWDGATTDGEATEITVTAGAAVSGIDAALAPGCPGFGSEGGSQIVGTSGADVLQGTPARDVICGSGGDDDVRGGPGNDLLLGNSGDDELRGSTGRDVLRSGSGADLLYGADGADSLNARGGRDRLFGGVGWDKLNGGPGDDRCDGGSGTDAGRSCEVERSVEFPP
jgi:Ca2+-binding RTX toxin-like protein